MDYRDSPHPPRAPWREKWNEIIFGHHTLAGRLFDLILQVLILLSVLTVLFESVSRTFAVASDFGIFAIIFAAKPCVSIGTL